MSERYGAYLLMLGLLMETNDQIFEPVLLGSGFEAAGIGLMVIFDALAVVLAATFVLQLLRAK